MNRIQKNKRDAIQSILLIDNVVDVSGIPAYSMYSNNNNIESTSATSVSPSPGFSAKTKMTF